MEMTYTEKDGIQYPKLQVSKTFKPITQMGKYGRMALKYLQETKPHRALEMKLNGTLMDTFHKVNEEANEMMISLQKQLLEKDPIPDQNDYMGAVRHRNMIRAQAEEIVLDQIVYQVR